MLQEALASIRPDGSSEREIQPDEVTGLLDLALAQLSAAQQETHEQLLRAAQRLDQETIATRALSQEILVPTKSGA